MAELLERGFGNSRGQGAPPESLVDDSDDARPPASWAAISGPQTSSVQLRHRTRCNCAIAPRFPYEPKNGLYLHTPLITMPPRNRGGPLGVFRNGRCGPAACAASARTGRRRFRLRQRDCFAKVHVLRGGVGDTHRLDEVTLEPRLDGRLDLLHLVDQRLDRLARAEIEQRDTRPGSRGVARGRDLRELAVRNHPEHHRVFDIDVRAERTRKPDASDVLRSESVHEQSDAGVKSGLGELDGAYVVLSDRQCLRALIDDIAKRAALRHDARTACGELSIDHTVLTDDAREEHLGNHFDDARAADPRDAGGLHGFLEPRLVGPQVGADDLEARLERRRVDPYALDRARRGALATADLCTLER